MAQTCAALADGSKTNLIGLNSVPGIIMFIQTNTIGNIGMLLLNLNLGAVRPAH